MANVELTDKLYQDLEAIVNDSSEFSDVATYVAYILGQVVTKKQQAAEASTEQDAVYSKEDEDKIRARLKNLGYLE